MRQTPEENKPTFSRVDIHEGDIETHLKRIESEFRDGFEFLRKYRRSVTIFGSSQAKPESAHYKAAHELADRVIRELSYAVVTGGGPGVMEAANKGAYEAGGPSLGMGVSIPHERSTNSFVTQYIKFSYFFLRKTMMTFAAEAYVFFPGGFGTFDELFSILTLIQTGKIPRVPIILFDSRFWNELSAYLKKEMVDKYGTIDAFDLKLFEITDSLDRVIEIVKKAPVSEWWRNIN